MGVRSKTLPYSVSDHILHGKDSDRTERIILPITRYDNVLCAPRVITNSFEHSGAPFYLMRTDKVDVSDTEIRRLLGLPLS